MVRNVCSHSGTDASSVAQDCKPVRYFTYLLEEMRYVDDGMSISFEFPDEREKICYILRSKAACRFIENQDLGSNRYRPGDFDKLPVSY